MISDTTQLYKEEKNSDGKLKFIRDERPKVIFEDPYKQTIKRITNKKTERFKQPHHDQDPYQNSYQDTSFDNQKTIRFDLSANYERLFHQIPEISSKLLL